MVLMKDVPSCLDIKCSVFSKLAELYARTDQWSYAKKMVTHGIELAVRISAKHPTIFSPIPTSRYIRDLSSRYALGWVSTGGRR